MLVLALGLCSIGGGADAQARTPRTCAELDAELRTVCEALHDSLTHDDPEAFARLVPDGGYRQRSRVPGTPPNMRVDRVRLRVMTPLQLIGLTATELTTERLLHQDVCDTCSSGPDCFGGCSRSYFLRFHAADRVVRVHFDRVGVTAVVVFPR